MQSIDVNSTPCNCSRQYLSHRAHDIALLVVCVADFSNGDAQVKSSMSKISPSAIDDAALAAAVGVGPADERLDDDDDTAAVLVDFVLATRVEADWLLIAGRGEAVVASACEIVGFHSDHASSSEVAREGQMERLKSDRLRTAMSAGAPQCRSEGARRRSEAKKNETPETIKWYRLYQRQEMEFKSSTRTTNT
jgi:hypothetical protein